MANRCEKAKAYTRKYKSQLCPCKWCSGSDIHITSDRSMFPKPQNVWSVDCATCGNCVYGLPKVKDAITRWNEQNQKSQPA